METKIYTYNKNYSAGQTFENQVCLLFKITAQICPICLKYFTGDNQAYSQAVINNTNLNIFLCGHLHGDDILQLEDWRFNYGNNKFGNINNTPNLFIGKYNNEYYIVADKVTSYYIELSSISFSYTNNINLEYVSQNVASDEVTKIEGTNKDILNPITYEDNNFSIIKYPKANGSTQYGFSWTLKFNSKYKYIWFGVDVNNVGYRTHFYDKDDNEIEVVNTNNLYDISKYEGPFTIQYFVSTDKNSNKQFGRYYFNISYSDDLTKKTHKTLYFYIDIDKISGDSSGLNLTDITNYGTFYQTDIEYGNVVKVTPYFTFNNKLYNFLGYDFAKSYGTTKNRPTLNSNKNNIGFCYFDTTINKPIWWNGTQWVEGATGSSGTDLDGAEVTDVETLEPTQEATATATIEDSKVKFTFAIPRGRDGQNGAPGKDGVNPTLPNYSIYRYCKSDSKPAAPTGTSQNPSGWIAIPNDTGNWWQCVGQVNGATGAVTQWGEVLPLNGRDGTAQDGRYTEIRYAKNSNRNTAPTISTNVRTPSGWSTTPPTVNVGEYLWMTTAIINPNDTLYTNWSNPICISGPQGAQGATGPAGNPGQPGSNGPVGIPGADILYKYIDGGKLFPHYDANKPNIDTYYKDDPSEVVTNDTFPYIWAVKGTKTYTDNTGDNYDIVWGKAFRLSGTNGLDGTAQKAQIIYPAGIYDINTTYTTTDKVAPYVLDVDDGNYYVLNAIMSWTGTEHDNLTPHEDYAINDGQYWLKFDGFNAIFAKIGIIANGLIGSAVFNGDWMFSQQGIDVGGSFSTDYKNFNSSNPFLSTNSFRPNIALNFRTGASYFSCGKVRFNTDGSGQLANGNVKWDSNGNTIVNGLFQLPFNSISSATTITLPRLEYQNQATIKIPYSNVSRLLIPFTIKKNSPNDVIFYTDSDNNNEVVMNSGNTDAEINIPYGYGYIEFTGFKDTQNSVTYSTDVWYVTIHSFGDNYSNKVYTINGK